MTALVVQFDDLTAAHLARALDNHRDWCRANGYDWPDTLATFRLMVQRTTGDQERTCDAAADVLAEHVRMGPLLHSYDDAATMLAVTPRQVRRLVAEGRLPYVEIAPRVRRINAADLDAFANTPKARTDG